MRALVRRGAECGHLERSGAELVTGDLRDRASLLDACAGVRTVVATATVVFPRGDYSFARDEGLGYLNLIAACRERGVGRLVYTSILEFPDHYRRRVPTLLWKQRVERQLIESGIPYTILRAGPFMDDYFALMGSGLPLVDSEAATLRRPFWLTRLYLRLVGRMIERRGIALVPRPPTHRHAFVALEDVAQVLLRAGDDGRAANSVLDLGGPQRLSWLEVAELYAKVLGHPVRTRAPAPAPLLRAASLLLRPFSEAAANQLGLLWALSRCETRSERDAAKLLGLRLTGAEEFLRGKLACT